MTASPLQLIGPFRQLLTMRELILKGPIVDESLEVIPEGGILIQGERILGIGSWKSMRKAHPQAELQLLEGDQVGLPGFVDAHTHICSAGSRAGDYAARNAGRTYLEIAQAGGGIWHSVQHTRAASQQTLVEGIVARAQRLLKQGITTVEVKSGYGLNVETELRMLRAIQEANDLQAADLIPTCLAAHILPRDFSGDARQYLDHLVEALFPLLRSEGLSNRIDIFIEPSTFDPAVALPYLQQAKAQGFDCTAHADQFTTGGSSVAIQAGAISADHLEVSGEAEIRALAQSEVIPVALPGASMGLGEPFTPARRLLDAGSCLAIASDWNPGSAPMGALLLQACVLGSYQKLSNAEVLAGISFRASAALGLPDRGRITAGYLADFLAFPTADYREIFYQQGQLLPAHVWKKGVRL